MISPSKLYAVAAKYEDENMAFRQFLKEHADSETLDAQFLQLHNELFAGYDCCKCNNCCRAYAVVLDDNDIEVISRHLGQSTDDFMQEYLEKSDYDEIYYKFKTQPCTFLCTDGKCSIYHVRPSECRGFPFTDHPHRLESLFGVICFAEECPIVFEILEHLKKIYNFRYRL